MEPLKDTRLGCLWKDLARGQGWVFRDIHVICKDELNKSYYSSCFIKYLKSIPIICKNVFLNGILEKKRYIFIPLGSEKIEKYCREGNII